MKITNVKTILLTGPCTLDPYLSEIREVRSAAFIKIETDSGLTGVGETYAGYFFPEVIPEVVDFFKPILLGNNVEVKAVTCLAKQMNKREFLVMQQEDPAIFHPINLPERYNTINISVMMRQKKDKFKRQEHRTFIDWFISVPAKITRSGHRTEIKMYENHFYKADWQELDRLVEAA